MWCIWMKKQLLMISSCLFLSFLFSFLFSPTKKKNIFWPFTHLFTTDTEHQTKIAKNIILMFSIVSFLLSHSVQTKYLLSRCCNGLFLLCCVFQEFQLPAGHFTKYYILSDSQNKRKREQKKERKTRKFCLHYNVFVLCSVIPLSWLSLIEWCISCNLVQLSCRYFFFFFSFRHFIVFSFLNSMEIWFIFVLLKKTK